MIATFPEADSLAGMLRRLGNVPPERILMQPAPGIATPRDVLQLCEHEPKRICELVDGVLVEKVMGHRESRIAVELSAELRNFNKPRNLGVVSGADGPHQLDVDLVRFPDVAFISWDNIPRDADPQTPMPEWVPSLAVEVVSQTNSRGEMKRKLEDYFAAGVDLVWYVYPDEGLVRVYTSVDECQTLTEEDFLDGGSVLPGFRLSVKQLLESGMLRRPNE